MEPRTEFSYQPTIGSPTGSVFVTRVGGTTGTHLFLDAPPERLRRELSALLKWLEANTDQDIKVVLT